MIPHDKTDNIFFQAVFVEEKEKSGKRYDDCEKDKEKCADNKDMNLFYKSNETAHQIFTHDRFNIILLLLFHENTYNTVEFNRKRRFQPRDFFQEGITVNGEIVLDEEKFVNDGRYENTEKYSESDKENNKNDHHRTGMTDPPLFEYIDGGFKGKMQNIGKKERYQYFPELKDDEKQHGAYKKEYQ